jgi:hypothetical protein
MTIQSRSNFYTGINAHLHSSLQHEFGGWEGFHGSHIIHITETIDAQLPPGYLVQPEKSLQIREYHPTTGEKVSLQKKRRPRPDLTIYQTNPSAGQITIASQAAFTPTLTLTASEAIEYDPDIYLTAVVIREVLGDGVLGKPVTWIELLSPTNKVGEGFLQYREKRISALEAGIVLVEMDYLHETRSPIQRLPSYPDYEAGAYPYSIIVTDPRPSLQMGQMKVYGFRVDDPIPVVAIPLANEDVITLDFGAIYRRTYSSIGAYSYRVDYEQMPIHFEAYSPDDQARIRAVMERATSLN